MNKSLSAVPLISNSGIGGNYKVAIVISKESVWVIHIDGYSNKKGWRKYLWLV